jgi:nucleoside-triphosphatase THEP1
MTLAPRILILWTGPKHSGKTTAARRLVEATRARGWAVAGCLAPSLYENNQLVGFEVVHLGNDRRAILARRRAMHDQENEFEFLADGWALGEEALGPGATKGADLIIIDEYGPLELASQGWRAAAERLMTTTEAALLLVVREELAEKVRQLYGGIPSRTVVATAPESIGEILALLANPRRSSSYE